MRNTKRENARQRLVDATLDSLAEHGYSGASLRTISANAGVTAGLVRYYFSGKSELIVESYRHFRKSALMDYISEAECARHDPVQRLETFARAILLMRACGGRRLMKIWISFLELVITEPRIGAIQAEVYELYLRELKECVTEIHAERGEALTENSARKLAIGIYSTIDGLWLESALNPGRMDSEESLDIALDLIAARLGVTFSSRIRDDS